MFCYSPESANRLNGPDQPYSGSSLKPWAQKFCFSSAWCFQSLPEIRWRRAGLQLSHNVSAWLCSPAPLELNSRQISWLDLGSTSSLWTCLVITHPGPDQWMNSWLELGVVSLLWNCLMMWTRGWTPDTISWSFLPHLVQAVAGGFPEKQWISLSPCLAFTEGAALLLLLSDTSQQIINFTDSNLCDKDQQDKREPRWPAAFLRYDPSLLQSHSILLLAKPLWGWNNA